MITSKFCPWCSNEKAVDGSYQEIGYFVVMALSRLQGYNLSEGYYEYYQFECQLCGHVEDVNEKGGF